MRGWIMGTYHTVCIWYYYYLYGLIRYSYGIIWLKYIQSVHLWSQTDRNRVHCCSTMGSDFSPSFHVYGDCLHANGHCNQGAILLLFLVSLLFVAVINPYSVFKFLIFKYSSNNICTTYYLVILQLIWSWIKISLLSMVEHAIMDI